MNLKSKIRSLSPALYHRVWVLKRYIRQRLSPRWNHYYEGADPWLSEPAPVLAGLPLPDSIDTVLDLGCASGRNFIPFDGKYRLWGIDIVPEERIRWVRSFGNMRYDNCRVEQFTRRIEHEHLDLSRTFIMSFGTLMYLSKREQMRFYEASKRAGCKNFFFQEPPPESEQHGPVGEYFKLPIEEFDVTKGVGPKKNANLYVRMDRA